MFPCTKCDKVCLCNLFCRADLQERYRRHYGWCRGCHGWRTFCGPGELAAEYRKLVENSLQARTTTWIHRNQGGHLPALLAPGLIEDLCQVIVTEKPFPLQTIWPHQQTVLMFCWCFSVFKCCDIISTCGNLVPPFPFADPLRCSVVLLQIFGVSPILSGLRLPCCRPVRSRKPPMRKVLKLQPSSIFQIFRWKQTDWMVKWIRHFAPRKALWGGRDSAWGLECEASTELARVTWLHTYNLYCQEEGAQGRSKWIGYSSWGRLVQNLARQERG